jgi:hypothetical protein
MHMHGVFDSGRLLEYCFTLAALLLITHLLDLSSYCTVSLVSLVSLVFLFVCVVQRADDLAILSSIQIIWSSGSNCMVVSTHHGTTQYTMCFSARDC